MYWYYKYPLLIVLVALLGGVGYIVWQSSKTLRTGKPVPEPVVTPADKPVVTPAADPDEPEVEPLPGPVEPLPIVRDDDPAVASTDLPPLVAKLLAAARSRVNDGKLESGRNIALRALQAAGVAEFSASWYEAAEVISKANSLFMNSAAPCSEKVGYTIRVDDNLTVIANRLGTTVKALQRLNPEMLRGTSNRIYPGKTLFALKGDWSIRVSKSQFALQLLNGDRFFKLYRIAVGRQNRTPVGTFLVSNKVDRPDWTHPSGNVIPYGDKANVLGTHWLAIMPTGATDPNLRGFGIHGTWEPESIGTAASLGCVRMRNADVAELYDFIPLPRAGRGIKVTIEN